MTNTHVVSALRAKRAEISGYIHDLEKKIKTQRARLAHIDASIRIFSPETDPEAIPARRTYRRARYFSAGEMPRRCLDYLRQASNPVSATTIIEAIMTAKGLSVDDPALRGVCTERLLSVLRTFKMRGKVIKTGVSRDAKWSLAN